MTLEGLKTAFNYYMELGAGRLHKILSLKSVTSKKKSSLCGKWQEG